MPTPRPACCVILPAVEKPGSRIELHGVFVAERRTVRDQPERGALVANRLEIHAGAVVGQAHHDFGAFTMQLERDAARVVLAGGGALVRLLDAVNDGVAEHVLERRQHALEHLAIELARGAFDDQLGALAGIGCGLGARCARDAARDAGTEPCACA